MTILSTNYDRWRYNILKLWFFQTVKWHVVRLKFQLCWYYAFICAIKWVERRITHVQFVVNAQFEDRIPARICPGDSVKQACLVIHVLCRGGMVYMRVYVCICVCICVYVHHYDRHQSSTGTQGSGAPKRGTCPLLLVITLLQLLSAAHSRVFSAV